MASQINNYYMILRMQEFYSENNILETNVWPKPLQHISNQYIIKLLKPKNHYNHGYLNTFDYNHYVYSDYLVCSVLAIAHIIRY